MRRLAAPLVALVALLAAAPGAWAATYTVNDGGDYPPGEPAADGICDANPGGGDQCTLREAIVEANATAADDTIVFDAGVTVVTPTAGPLPAVTDRLTIDGGGGVTVDTPPATSTPLLRFAIGAEGSALRSITLRGTGADTATTLLSVTAGGFAGTAVAFRNARGAAAQLAGPGGSLANANVSGSGGPGLVLAGTTTSAGGATVTGSGGYGIVLSGQGASVSGSTVTGSGSNGIQIVAPDTRVAGGSVHGNAGSGIGVATQNAVVSQVILYGNGGRPIELAPGANGGIQPPQNLRIGPRRSDGSLPLTGTTSGGTLEVFSGNPFSASMPSYFFSHGVAPGDFAYHFGAEPAPGATFAVTLTAGGTSEFALVSVPGDVESPAVLHARAISTTEVRVAPTEPLDPATVQAEDFRLAMAGQERPITGASVAPDGSIALISSGWRPGEAGYVDVTAPGAVRDTVGNESVLAGRYRVAAAPGDFIAPIATRMKLRPKSICLTRARKCRRTGGSLRFIASEEGKVEVVVQRGNKRVGTRTFTVKPGVNRVKFDGRLRGRKLRAGRYRLLLFMTDIVGNRNPNPPITLFSIRRVTK